jgi:hypothetical protein
MIPVAELEVSGMAPASAAARRSAPPRGSFRLLRMAAMLVRETRPLAFYGAFAMLLWAVGLMILLPGLAGALETGSQPVAAIVGTGLLLAGFGLAGCGLVLQSLHRSSVEQRRILFLAVPALGAH